MVGVKNYHSVVALVHGQHIEGGEDQDSNKCVSRVSSIKAYHVRGKAGTLYKIYRYVYYV